MKEEVSEKKDLRQRTATLALRAIRMFVALPKTTLAPALAKQVLRSRTSIGASYRGAHRVRSKNEFVAKCGDSLREAEETAYWLGLIFAAKLVPAARSDRFAQKADELISIFVTIISARKNPDFIPLPLYFILFRLSEGL